MAKKRKRTGAHRPAPSRATPDAASSEPHASGGDADAQPARESQDGTARPSRGRERRAARRREREALQSPSRASGEEPAFFFDFEVTWAKLALARVVVFALLAYDALDQIPHAPRYGAGDFNVGHLPLLGAIAPDRVAYSVGQLVSAYLFVLAACGVATRFVVPIATTLYGWLYFTSQLDSYQHHYLVFLVLVLACGVPWQRPPDETGKAVTPATPVRTWAVRSILIQLAVLYFWAAVSKLHPAWLDGKTLATQLQGGVRSLVDATIGLTGAAWLVLTTELVLALTIWFRRGWIVAAPLGIALHVGILATDLDIGLFAYLMLGLYILVVPDRVWVWLAERSPMRALRGAAHVIADWFSGGARFVVCGLAAGLAVVLAMVSRFDHGPSVGLAISLVAFVVLVALRKRPQLAWLATAHLLAFVMSTTVDRTTDIAADYFRLWGGSSRRLGDPATAEHAYRQMTKVAPDNPQGFYQLGRLLLARNADEDGLAALRRAQDLEPLRARAYVAEARWLATHGRREEALAKAREAVLVDPKDAEARRLLDSLQGTRR